jgi:hypothetical protein
MKKLLSTLLIVAAMLALTACGEDDEIFDVVETTVTTEATTPSATAAPEPICREDDFECGLIRCELCNPPTPDCGEDDYECGLIVCADCNPPATQAPAPQQEAVFPPTTQTPVPQASPHCRCGLGCPPVDINVAGTDRPLCYYIGNSME